MGGPHGVAGKCQIISPPSMYPNCFRTAPVRESAGFPTSSFRANDLPKARVKGPTNLKETEPSWVSDCGGCPLSQGSLVCVCVCVCVCVMCAYAQYQVYWRSKDGTCVGSKEGWRQCCSPSVQGLGSERILREQDLSLPASDRHHGN